MNKRKLQGRFRERAKVTIARGRPAAGEDCSGMKSYWRAQERTCPPNGFRHRNTVSEWTGARDESGSERGFMPPRL
jgi:hypothetical protein